MSVKINEDCIICNACLAECPNTAIYENGDLWTMAKGTSLTGKVKTSVGEIDASAEQEPVGLGNQIYYVVPDKCTECVGFNETPACMKACPVDCIDFDPDFQESQEELLLKKARLHL